VDVLRVGVFQYTAKPRAKHGLTAERGAWVRAGGANFVLLHSYSYPLIDRTSKVPTI
jgi:hypothetical protein